MKNKNESRDVSKQQDDGVARICKVVNKNEARAVSEQQKDGATWICRMKSKMMELHGSIKQRARMKIKLWTNNKIMKLLWSAKLWTHWAMMIECATQHNNYGHYSWTLTLKNYHNIVCKDVNGRFVKYRYNDTSKLSSTLFVVTPKT